jgi:hypothetical protein
MHSDAAQSLLLGDRVVSLPSGTPKNVGGEILSPVDLVQFLHVSVLKKVIQALFSVTQSFNTPG